MLYLKGTVRYWKITFCFRIRVTFGRICHYPNIIFVFSYNDSILLVVLVIIFMLMILVVSLQSLLLTWWKPAVSQTWLLHKQIGFLVVFWQNVFCYQQLIDGLLWIWWLKGEEIFSESNRRYIFKVIIHVHFHVRAHFASLCKSPALKLRRLAWETFGW